ncbi:uncharacterized protein B0H18DRAFT_959598 [Fomitopsis serialis]|uniref:uncharacterized protein n=1 Tax=Fomitopsis serialis TaxID=139415 RepID=UPI002007DB1E|nr:uncharacterized protein B0H18DRAFT_959598 [Neoantrodia serialis]KAH9914862.1 hypothetical protein B0H18DRAFT_959598 [Neoantrodia serialis]
MGTWYTCGALCRTVGNSQKVVLATSSVGGVQLDCLVVDRAVQWGVAGGVCNPLFCTSTSRDLTPLAVLLFVSVSSTTAGEVAVGRSRPMVLPEQSTAQQFDEGRVQLCIAIAHVKTPATIAIATSAAVCSGPAAHVPGMRAFMISMMVLMRTERIMARPDINVDHNGPARLPDHVSDAVGFIHSDEMPEAFPGCYVGARSVSACPGFPVGTAGDGPCLNLVTGVSDRTRRRAGSAMRRVPWNWRANKSHLGDSLESNNFGEPEYISLCKLRVQGLWRTRRGVSPNRSPRGYQTLAINIFVKKSQLAYAAP